MSKAFVKDESSETEIGYHPRELVSPSENYMTVQGLERLRQELSDLEAEKIVLMESEKTAPQELRVQEITDRVRLLHEMIESALPIDPEKQQGDRVLFGATVTVEDQNESERVYQLVGVNETDARAGRISWISPIGKALLQARAGDVVKFQTPHGPEELQVKSVEFQA